MHVRGRVLLLLRVVMLSFREREEPASAAPAFLMAQMFQLRARLAIYRGFLPVRGSRVRQRRIHDDLRLGERQLGPRKRHGRRSVPCARRRLRF